MTWMDIRKRNRHPAKGYSLVSARQAIFHLASHAEEKNIREAALKHIGATLSDEKKVALERCSNVFDRRNKGNSEEILSKFDVTECQQDQDFLSDVARTAFSHGDRNVAIGHLSDQEILKDIAINVESPNPENALTALSKLEESWPLYMMKTPEIPGGQLHGIVQWIEPLLR
jgi:hypothetical protein